MPIKVVCNECGYVLLDCSGLPEPSETWYEKLLCDVHGKCPKCGHKLPTPMELRDKMQITISGNPATMHLSPTVASFERLFHKRRYIQAEEILRVQKSKGGTSP